MGWLIALGVLVLLGAIPIGIRGKYDAHGPLVKLILGFVGITLYPRPKKEKKQKKQPETIDKTGEAPSASAQEPGPDPKPKDPPQKKKPAGGPVTDFLPLVEVVLDFLDDFRRKLRVNRLELKVILAGEDPCDLAVNYGRAWAALGNLWPRLERWLVIRKRDVQVQCDFTADQTLVTARLDVSITLGRLLGVLAVLAVRGLAEYLKILKKRKGGVLNEPKSS